MSKDLDEIVGILTQFSGWCLCDHDECEKSRNFDKATQEIKALIHKAEKSAMLRQRAYDEKLIHQAEVKARVQELKHLTRAGEAIPYGGKELIGFGDGLRFVHDRINARIKALQAEDKP